MSFSHTCCKNTFFATWRACPKSYSGALVALRAPIFSGQGFNGTDIGHGGQGLPYAFRIWRLMDRATHGTPKSIAELSDHSIIGFDYESAYIRQLQDQFPWFSRAALAFRADSDLAQLAAMRAGFGICQSALAAKDKALVRLLPTQFSIMMDT